MRSSIGVARQRLPLRELGRHPAPSRPPARRRRRCRARRRGTRPRRRRAMSTEKRARAGHDVDQPRLELDLADRADRALAGRAREPLELEDALGGDDARVEPEVHRRRARVVGAALDRDVGVHVAGDRRDDADPVARVLEDARLLDVHLDPAREVVEDVDRLAPALGLVAGVGRVLPERAPVVDGAERLAQLLLGDALEHDPAPEQHLPEARALLLEEGDELERQVEPEVGVQPADLERGDDAHRAVVLAAVPVRVAVRADAEDLLAGRAVARDERADRILGDVEAELAKRGGEVVERRAVDRRVRVAPDRLVGERVAGRRRASRCRARSGLRSARDRRPPPLDSNSSRLTTIVTIWPNGAADGQAPG